MSSEYNKVDNEVLSDYSDACSVQTRWQGLNETIRKLVRPTSPSFVGGTNKGEVTSERIYDSTALWASEQLASGLHTYLMDPASRWFALSIRGLPFNQLSHEALYWLEHVSDTIYAHFQDATTRTHQSIKETLQDVSSYGTGVLLTEWDSKAKALKVRSFPLASCKIMEGPDGIVNKVYRDMYMTIGQIQKQFPKAVLPANMLSGDKTHQYKVTHGVFPNEKFVTSQFVPEGISKRFASIYFIEESSLELQKGGYDLFPYAVPRWTTMAGEIYGRGPAVTAAPDIQLINLMYKELIMAAQLANRPPLVMDDDSFMLPISYTPGSLIFRTPGAADPIPLQGGGNFGITLELINQKREQIAKAFHVDWLLRDRKKERQSVVEINDERQEMLQQITSVLGRLESELCSALIRNTYFFLDRAGKFPTPPSEIQKRGLEIIYTSPAAKSKDVVKAQNIMQYLADLAPVSAVRPDIYDGIDFPALGQELAVHRDVSRRILLSPEQVAEKKRRDQEAANQQQRLLQSQQLGEVAGALKDVASAQQSGLVQGG